MLTYSSDAAPDGSKTVIIPDCATAQCTNCAGSFGNRVYVKDDNAEIILDELENGFSYIASPFDGCIIDGNKITEITKDIVISLAAHEMQYRLEGDEVFVSARNKKIWGGIYEYWQRRLPAWAQVAFNNFVFVYKGNSTVEVKRGSDGLSGAIEIPATDPKGNKVVAIAISAFSQTNISSVIIPEGVERIGDMAFIQCQSLSYVKIPSSRK